MLLKDRVAIITGAGSGIGQGVAKRFASEGAKLALVDIRPDSLEDTRARLKDSGTEFETYTGDVSITADVEGFFRAVQRFGLHRYRGRINAGDRQPLPAPRCLMTDEGLTRPSPSTCASSLCTRCRPADDHRGRWLHNSALEAGKTGFAPRALLATKAA
jgi:NAD(P)-dependent dehydrogenase (short-subunit alcohol dehydrogenase family)